MHLGVDGLVWRSQETGVGVATRNLICQCGQIYSTDTITSFISDDSILVNEAEGSLNHDKVLVSQRWHRLNRLPWQHVILPQLARLYRVDALYRPAIRCRFDCIQA